MKNLHMVRITRITDIAEGVVALDLRSAENRPLPAWTPGAHVDVHLTSGLIRQYSLCGDPADGSAWRIAVRRTEPGRGGSRHVHTRLAAGDVLRVGGPRNLFPLLPAPRYLFLAGGIGITPILPMLAAAQSPWELHYAGRTAESMPFRAHLSAGYGDRVHLYPDRRIDLDPLLERHAPGTLVYCCGPAGMLRAVAESCTRHPGRPLHIEHFTPASTPPSAGQLPADQHPAGRRGAFEVELAASGRTLTVPPDRSILEAVEAAGITVLSSCREGTCGTCETTVLSGTVDHRDSLLTPEERAANDTIFLCVSRAAGPHLVLDL
ncbi:PDR/VanB family oxidoreductase [Actinoplanes subglobosus]|uniref:PDR/VanB family oxidoreductase n=1 Tax=Actinoplanes subglobosus TaxID=1547892 RepID=A0ABV8J2D0_9ACTN